MTDTHTTKAAIVAAPPTTDALDRADRERVHPLIRAAMDHGLSDPSALDKLLDVQERWERNEARKAFHAAKAALKAELPTVIERDQVVDFATSKGRTHYTHASLAQVMDAITDPLVRYGFDLSWQQAMLERGGVAVTCRLTHAGGHSEETTLAGPADTSGNKSAVQGIASTVTLLQRYTALSLLGIATADMKEPTQAEPDPTRVDGAANRRAARAMLDAGVTMEECVARCNGRTVQQWTAADLDTLRGELRRRKAHASGELTEEEERAMEAERG